MSDDTSPDDRSEDPGDEPTDEGERRRHAEARVEAILGFAGHLAVFLAVNLAFLIVVGLDWLWVTAFWSIGLVTHGWSVFAAQSRTVSDWKERMVQRELARDDDAGSPSASG